MLSAKFDTGSKLTVELTLSDADVISLGESYVEYESGLPEEVQLREPPLDLIRTTLTEAKAASEQAVVNENLRAASATDYSHAVIEAKGLMKEAVVELKHKYRKNRARLQDWGLITSVGKKVDVVVTLPATPRQWADFLHDYVVKEQGLPEAERIVDPPLTRLVELDVIIQNTLALRTRGTGERGIGVKNRLASVARLLDLLQAAAVVLVVTRYNGGVTEELARWGYKVVEKTAAPAAAAEEETPVEETPA
jgi:hypothetical protein